MGRARSLEEERGEVISSSLRCGWIGSSTRVTAEFNQTRSAEYHEILPSQDASPTSHRVHISEVFRQAPETFVRATDIKYSLSFEMIFGQEAYKANFSKFDELAVRRNVGFKGSSKRADKDEEAKMLQDRSHNIERQF